MLICKRGKTTEKFELKSGVTLIGKDLSNDFVVNSRKVSEKHALIEYHPLTRSFWLRDLHSGQAGGCVGATESNGRLVYGMIELRAGDLLRFGDKEFQFQMPALPKGPLTNQQAENGSAKRYKFSRRAQSTGGLASRQSNGSDISLPVVGEKIHPHNFNERFTRTPTTNQRLCKLKNEPVPRLVQTGKSLSQVADEPLELLKNGKKPPKGKTSENSGNRSGENSYRSDWYPDGGSIHGSIDSATTHSTGNQLVHRVIRLQNELHRKEIELARIKEANATLPRINGNGDINTGKQTTLDNAALSVIRINELVYQTFFVVSCKELQDVSRRLNEPSLKDNIDVFTEAYKVLQEPFSYRLMEVNSKCGVIFDKAEMSQDQKDQLFDKFDHFFSDQLNPISKAVDGILPALREASQLARESLKAANVFTQWSREFAAQLQLQPGWEVMGYKVDDLQQRFKDHNMNKHWLPQALVPILKVMIYESKNLADEMDRQAKDHNRALRALTEKNDDLVEELEKEKAINQELQQTHEEHDLVRELQTLRIQNHTLQEKLRLYEQRRRITMVRSKSQGEPKRKQTKFSTTTIPNDIETRILRDASLESRVPTPATAKDKEEVRDTVSSCSRCSTETETESSQSMKVDERAKISSVKTAVGEWEKRVEDRAQKLEEIKEDPKTYAATLINNITNNVTGRLASAVIGGVITGPSAKAMEEFNEKMDDKSHDDSENNNNPRPEITEDELMEKHNALKTAANTLFSHSSDGERNNNQVEEETQRNIDTDLQEEPYTIKYELFDQQVHRQDDEKDPEDPEDVSDKVQVADLGVEKTTHGNLDDPTKNENWIKITPSEEVLGIEELNDDIQRQSSHEFFEKDDAEEVTIREIKNVHEDLENFDNGYDNVENKTISPPSTGKECEKLDGCPLSPKLRSTREVEGESKEDDDSQITPEGTLKDAEDEEIFQKQPESRISRENSSKTEHTKALAEEHKILHSDRSFSNTENSLVQNDDEEYPQRQDNTEKVDNQSKNGNTDQVEPQERDPSVIEDEDNGEWKELHEVLRQASNQSEESDGDHPPLKRGLSEPLLREQELAQPESGRSGCTKRAESAEILVPDDAVHRKDTRATNEDIDDEILDEAVDENDKSYSKRQHAYEFWELAKVLAEALAVDLPGGEEADFTAIDQDESVHLERYRRELAVDAILDRLRQLLHKIRRQETIMSRQTSIRSSKSIDGERKLSHTVDAYKLNGGFTSPPIAEQVE
ncbi:unnamed protein product [Bursaphelenchus xylophilus]|uniref:(pine wood nematode) hypothetical protein n=1 Tax=Bursaphelenchus xylophilus TaxID=6326 RepID=A0A1I7RPB5_BURXY|nr:unnamed protein product [Bursaphelenchus xylophilus]CAG9095737.1 unnamed protein product [Bursaphelenchus xylophilus]